MIQFDNAVSRYNKIILDELKKADIVCWIAGGALRDYFMGVAIKTDIDLFFPNEAEYTKCAQHMRKGGATLEWESNNGMKLKYNGRLYDLVKFYSPSPQETIDEFDFTVSMIAIDCDKVYFGETTFIDLAKRQLMLNKLQFPANTMRRAFRYYKKGFSMCVGEMEKLVIAIQDMPKPEKQEAETDITDAPISGGGKSRMFVGID